MQNKLATPEFIIWFIRQIRQEIFVGGDEKTKKFLMKFVFWEKKFFKELVFRNNFFKNNKLLSEKVFYFKKINDILRRSFFALFLNLTNFFVTQAGHYTSVTWRSSCLVLHWHLTPTIKIIPELPTLLKPQTARWKLLNKWICFTLFWTPDKSQTKSVFN